MYAHQVIEACKKILKIKKYQKDEDVIKWVNGYVKDIKKAQKFHLGNICGYDSIIISKLNKPLFDDPGKEVVRLPFKTVWLDWFYKKDGHFQKSGMIITEANQDYYCTFFHFVKNEWHPSIVVYLIHYNENINNFYVDMRYPTRFEKECERIANSNCDGTLTILDVFFNILNCKNITTEKEHPNKKINKNRIKKGKQPLFSYHTLVIKPTAEQEKSIPQHLWNNRVHLCRGHFKTYTADNPLFGQHTGRYWWQPSVKGNKELGIIEKDYLVKTQ